MVRVSTCGTEGYVRARALRGVTVVRGRRVVSVGAADGLIIPFSFQNCVCVFFVDRLK